MQRKDRGFTLIELLIVVAIIGIIAAIAIPNLLNAIDRGRQKRTMADMRSIGTAVEAYSVDENQYPNTGNTTTLVDVNGNLDTYIEPIYIKKAPDEDGWSNPLKYASDSADYTIRSYGKDRTKQNSPPGGKTSNFDDDIIFIDGAFTQWPEGQQQ
ncbi:MAG: prepilin-type N-terminal cleavage/methylation domain-containing protein [Acidobacteria bacterium]|nr:MAG: prepilin-type N-terminal cleavage/methylation domain-containing protein [Acidobacteriota bacterium]